MNRAPFPLAQLIPKTMARPLRGRTPSASAGVSNHVADERPGIRPSVAVASLLEQRPSFSLALGEFGGEVVFGDRDERVGHGDSWLGAFAAVVGSPASPVVALLHAGVLD